MTEQSDMSGVVRDVWYACTENEQQKKWVCQGPYDTAKLADDFSKERLNAHTTLIVNAPVYLPPIMREHLVCKYIIDQYFPKITFKKPGDTSSSSSLVTDMPVEWVAH